ncbi:MAG TPA: autotransporter-associated beta strand repeat-containing protein, partial [Tepidisphaeraceae bacterium]|nr:autotransporter-associated beta strand repeat-containing protein [Tepidisphaeraceae bacterium]
MSDGNRIAHKNQTPSKRRATKSRLLRIGHLPLLVAAAGALAPRVSSAASDSWTGGGGDALWSDALNWSTNPGTVPGTGDTATFNSLAGAGGQVIDLGAGVTVSTLQFSTPNADSYTIGAGGAGSQTLTLNNGGAVTMNSKVANDELLNAAIVLGTDGSTQSFTFTNNSTTNSLIFAGNITGSTGSGVKSLVVTGAGAVSISGAVNNDASGTVALTKSGTGTLTLTGANLYTGTTTVNGGTLDIGGGTSNGSISSSSALSLGGGTLTLTNTAGTTQTFNGATLTGGASFIKNTGNGGILALGALTKTAGSGATVDFTATGTITTGASNDASDGGGILGGWATTGNAVSSNSTGDWAANDGSGNIVAYTGYTLLATTGNLSTNGAGASTQNWETGALNGTNHITTLTASATINSLVQQGDFGINSGATLTLASGGLMLKGISRWMLNNNAGTTAGTGKLTSGLASGELFIHT